MHDFTTTAFGYSVMAVLIGAYGLVFLEEHLNLPKSIPVIIGGCVISIIAVLAYQSIDAGKDILA